MIPMDLDGLDLDLDLDPIDLSMLEEHARSLAGPPGPRERPNIDMDMDTNKFFEANKDLFNQMG